MKIFGNKKLLETKIEQQAETIKDLHSKLAKRGIDCDNMIEEVAKIRAILKRHTENIQKLYEKSAHNARMRLCDSLRLIDYSTLKEHNAGDVMQELDGVMLDYVIEATKEINTIDEAYEAVLRTRDFI